MESNNENAPGCQNITGALDRRKEKVKTSLGATKYTTAPADQLLSRLDGVRETGPGQWLARCPAHDDRSPSLSIRDVDDRVLIHCFAGCAPADVVAAVSLELADLYQRPLAHHVRPNRSRIAATDALIAIDREALVLTIIASDFRKTRELDDATWDRLLEAAQRIGAARDRVAPGRVPK